MKIPCTICEEIEGKANPYLGESYSILIETRQNVLLETENFFVFPSVGALHPSHSLIVPRQHMFSFAFLPTMNIGKEIQAIKKSLRKVNHAAQNQCVFFEHGMGCVSDTSGSCVSHAHIHVIAGNPNFESQIRSSVPFVKLPNFYAISEVASKEQGYVYFEDSTELIVIANRPNLPSQFFRKVYAENSDNPLVWNWRIDKQKEMTYQSVEYYKALRDVYERSY